MGNTNEKLSGDFLRDTARFDELLQPDKSFDIIKREMEISGTSIAMYYIDGFVKAEMLQKLMHD